jgi:hypothetical protein
VPIRSCGDSVSDQAKGRISGRLARKCPADTDGYGARFHHVWLQHLVRSIRSWPNPYCEQFRHPNHLPLLRQYPWRTKIPGLCPFYPQGTAYLLTGGIVQLSRCLRESFISHCVRDRPAGVLREQLVASAALSRLTVRKLTLACATTRHAACCRTQEASSTLPLRQIKTAHKGRILIWRRGRDSNPR